eukprot:symbB.v1.2.019922.t1/scaffold1652.1/size121070/2
MDHRVLVTLALFSSVVLGQEDCGNWTCPEGYQAKADASSLLCDGDGDEVQDLYLCCNQLCSGFMCNTYLTLPSAACAGPCDPVRDLARCCDIPMVQDESIQLLRASAASEVRHVDRLVAMKVNSSTAPGGTTALHFAALHGHTAMLRRLLAGGADVNALDDHGWAPLHLAAGAGRLDAMNLLVAAGAVPDQHSPDGTPYDVAVRSGKQSTALTLALAEHVRALQDDLNFSAGAG